MFPLGGVQDSEGRFNPTVYEILMHLEGKQNLM